MIRRIETVAGVRVGSAAAVVAALALAGCSSASSPVTSPASAGSSTVRSSQATGAASTSVGATTGGGTSPTGSARTAVSIAIENFAYRVSGPVAPGATVRVTNDDTIEHTVTADSGHGFDVAVQPGKTVTFAAPNTAGRYQFHCDFHSDMHGTLTVK